MEDTGVNLKIASLRVDRAQTKISVKRAHVSIGPFCMQEPLKKQYIRTACGCTLVHNWHVGRTSVGNCDQAKRKHASTNSVWLAYVKKNDQ